MCVVDRHARPFGIARSLPLAGQRVPRVAPSWCVWGLR